MKKIIERLKDLGHIFLGYILWPMVVIAIVAYLPYAEHKYDHKKEDQTTASRSTMFCDNYQELQGDELTWARHLEVAGQPEKAKTVRNHLHDLLEMKDEMCDDDDTANHSK